MTNHYTGKYKSKIINGKNAFPKELPYMAQLIRKPEVLFCGGTLISDWHILTAAHCLKGEIKDDVFIVLGSIWITGNNGLKLAVKSLIPHENHDPVTSRNDIGIVLVKRSVMNSFFFLH